MSLHPYLQLQLFADFKFKEHTYSVPEVCKILDDYKLHDIDCYVDKMLENVHKKYETKLETRKSLSEWLLVAKPYGNDTIWKFIQDKIWRHYESFSPLTLQNFEDWKTNAGDDDDDDVVPVASQWCTLL